jgi:phosphoglycerol geranylgeranyltransferase
MKAKERPWKNWQHITKLDPDKYISLDDLDTIVGSGTDAIMVSGTQNITGKNVSQLIAHLEDYDIPKILEPATPEAVIDDDMDYIFVPLVLNTGDLNWIVGKHKDWIQKHPINWEKVIPEAYIVMNPDSAVAKLTKSKTDLIAEEVIAYARYAERYLGLPIVYLEYSGAYGDPHLVQSLSDSLSEASLFYGGGIDSQATASEMKRYADVIVVGNIVYTDMDKFMATIP